MVINKKASIEMELDVFLFEEDDVWVSYCPALELSSYGDSKEEAKIAFEEAASIFFEVTAKKGSLEQCLKQLGWELKNSPSMIYNKPVLSLSNVIENISKKYQQYSKKVEIPAYC